MKIDFRLINYQQGRVLSANDVGKDLTPDLKARADPIEFAIQPVLFTKHFEKWFRLADYQDGNFNADLRPSFLKQLLKSLELLWKMVPEVPKVAGSSMSI